MEDLGASLGVPNTKMITGVGQQGYPNKQKNQGEGESEKKKKPRRKKPNPAAKLHITQAKITTTNVPPENHEEDDSGIGSHVDVKI